MALKPTIYKAQIALADLDREQYESFTLTLAQHPSETLERMMARLVVYCNNWQSSLSFTKGLSSVDEPDIWARTLDDQISLWIEIGEPSAERVKKATRLAQKTLVVCFNSKADVWWRQNQQKLEQLDASVQRLDWDEVCQLTKLVQRTMSIAITISEQTLYLSSETANLELTVKQLK